MQSLRGLAVGDALGKTWSSWSGRQVGLAERLVPSGTWTYTDDTVMAMAIVSTLERFERIEQDYLAAEFAKRFAEEPQRGYGAGAFWLLHRLCLGRDWRDLSRELFGGGSYGNGSAMRVAPIGAYFATDLDRVAREARASAEVTHAHEEAHARAIAIAIATALVTTGSTDGTAVLEEVVSKTPHGAVRSGIEKVSSLLEAPVEDAVAELGDGREVCCHDTVPFALWCVAKHLGRFEDAIFAALEGTDAPEADRDTMLAIVGGVVAMGSPPPRVWLDALEPL